GIFRRHGDDGSISRVFETTPFEFGDSRIVFHDQNGRSAAARTHRLPLDRHRGVDWPCRPTGLAMTSNRFLFLRNLKVRFVPSGSSRGKADALGAKKKFSQIGPTTA